MAGRGRLGGGPGQGGYFEPAGMAAMSYEAVLADYLVGRLKGCRMAGFGDVYQV